MSLTAKFEQALRLGTAVGFSWLTISCSGLDQAPQSDEIVTSHDEALHTVAGKSWTAQGPAPMIHGQAFTLPEANQNPVTGAVHALATDPTDSNIAYVGSVNGGVWRTSNALALRPIWTPLTDNLPSLNIGALALDRTNPQVVIAGTGRWSSLANDGGSQGEILISRNAGSTWTVLSDPLFAGQKLSGVVIRGNTVLASAVDFGGLVRSTNGGVSWTRVSDAPGSGLPFGGIDDLVEDRQNANRLYATLSGVGVFRSDNLGASWVNISRNDPGPGRLDDVIRNASIGARMTTASDGRAYVGIVSPGDEVSLIEYTTNGGATWVAMDRPGVSARGNPFLHFAIGADPTSPNIVYVTGIGSWQRGNANIAPTGGFGSPQWSEFASSGTPNFTSPHADERDIAFAANGDLILASDGGVFRRPTPKISADWISMAGNLQTGEIHQVAYDANSRIIFGGTQDNGTIFQTAPGSLSWDLFLFGDGGDVQVDVSSLPGSSIRYGSSQFLIGFNRATFDANNTLVSQTFIPLSGGAIQPQFYTPVELNRVDPRRLVLGASDAVYESFDQGDTITSLGPNTFAARTMFYGHPLNQDVLYVVRDEIFVRLRAGAPLLPTPTRIPSFDARDLVLDPANFRRAYVAAGTQGVLLTPDAGSTWTDITGNLTTFAAGDVRTIEFIPGTTHGLVVVGTNRGVFATASDALGVWEEVGNLPNAPVDDMQYSRRGDLLVISQLGRGAWSVAGLGGGNRPPIARCQDVVVDAGASCTATVNSAAVNNGSADPDGDAFTCVLVPAGPFNVGSTSVVLSCSDSQGASSTCNAKINVGPGNNSACCPAGTNVIVGNASDNVINGTAGRDCILGLAGQDTVNGLGGDDIISAGDGNDVVSGGPGNDLLFGGLGQDRLSGDLGNDVLACGLGDDQCSGGDGADSLFGGDGQDRLLGDAGNDRLVGGIGDDRLEGGDGDDVLDGSGFHDVCLGGPGTDSFLVCESQTQ